jgi:hypothetical protein
MRSRTVVGIAAVVVVIVGVGVWHHETGAQFRSSISPLATFGARGCRQELYGFGWRSPSFNTVCKHAGDTPAFRISIVNDGHGGALAQTCQVQVLDLNGAAMGDPFLVSLNLATPGGSGPYLDQGGTMTFDWFMPRTPSRPVGGYRVTCEPVRVRGLQQPI